MYIVFKEGIFLNLVNMDLFSLRNYFREKVEKEKLKIKRKKVKWIIIYVDIVG